MLEASKRFRLFEYNQEAASELLAAPEVQASDLPIPRYGEILDNLYLPNIKHGEVVIPRRYRNQEAAIPFIALGREAVRLAGPILSFSGRQADEVYKSFRACDMDQAMSREKLADLSGILSDPDQSELVIDYDQYELDEYRRVARNALIIGNEGFGALSNDQKIEFITFSGRPAIVYGLNMPKLPSDGLTLLHEVVHVDQHLREPIKMYPRSAFNPKTISRNSLENELEAFHIEHEIGRLLIEGGYLPDVIDPNLENLEAIRRQQNAFTRPYRLTEPILSCLQSISPAYSLSS